MVDEVYNDILGYAQLHTDVKGEKTKAQKAVVEDKGFEEVECMINTDDYKEKKYYLGH